MDNLSPEARRHTMQRVRGKDTGPEWAVRRLLHALGYRFRLHRRDLPGCPDLVLPGRRAALFVHGCFWHLHRCKAGRNPPRTNAAYWQAKRERNRKRDWANRRRLVRLGWRVLVVWECELRKAPVLQRRLRSFLGPARPK